MYALVHAWSVKRAVERRIKRQIPGTDFSVDDRANVVTHPLPSAIRLNAREEIKANLCPVVDALREFQRFVLCVVGGKHAVLDGFAAANREIGMDLDHSGMRCLGFRRIDLNFVVVLGGSPRGQARKQRREQELRVAASRSFG